MKLTTIGVIHSPFVRSEGTPIQSSLAKGAQGTAVIEPRYVTGLKDLDGFDRIWLLYWFDRAAEGANQLIVTPYLEDAPRGVFATRAPARPNPLGLSPVRLLSVEGNLLRLADLDILDGTPLLDIKPYVPRFDCFPTTRNGWFDVLADRQVLADRRFEK